MWRNEDSKTQHHKVNEKNDMQEEKTQDFLDEELMALKWPPETR